MGLWVTKMHMRFGKVLDVTAAEELKRIEHYDNPIAIGAAVTLTDAFDALLADRPQLKAFTNRFAGLPTRNSGTLGGNVANGSPIGDSMPVLIAGRALQGFDEGGKPRAMTLYEWQRTLRTDAVYGYDRTTGARRQAA